jgi:hypothetical protein
MRASHKGILLSALPNVAMLALFYTLAVHMYWSLGAWPTSIGESGFPRSLITHGYITMWFFGALIWVGIFIWPVAMLICAINRECRRAVPYLMLYALLFLGCWGLMQLAPEPFLYWWRD